MAGKTKAQLETDQLKSDVNDLKNMMMEFMKSQQIQNKNEVVSEIKTKKTEAKTKDDEDDEVINILPTQLINITSLFTGGMTLSGSHGKPIRFERFGQTMPVSFEDLNYVCSNNRRFAEDGYFYINNEKAIKLLYLGDAYERIVDIKTIENIILLSNDEIEKIYNNVTDNIKDSIIDFIVKGIISNKPLFSDRNKIDFISKLYKKDLNSVAKNLQEYEVK